MSSNYQLRSFTAVAVKNDSPKGLLSPSFVNKFKSLATSSVRKGTPVSPSLSSRKRASSKRVLKKTDTSAVPDTTTPTKELRQGSPRTAPPKMQTEDSPFLAPTSSNSRQQDFKVWEDPDVIQSHDDSLVPNRISLESNSDHKKENSPPPEYSAEPVAHQDVNSNQINRSVFGQVKVSAMEEYKKLIGESFKIISSPTAVFYSNNASKLSYPSSANRMPGSGNYRSAKVNLFRTKPGNNGIVLNNQSPTTPRRVPDYIHPSRVAKRLFKATTAGSGSVEEKTPKSSRTSYRLRPRPVTKNAKSNEIIASANFQAVSIEDSGLKKSKRC